MHRIGQCFAPSFNVRDAPTELRIHNLLTAVSILESLRAFTQVVDPLVTLSFSARTNPKLPQYSQSSY
jgi:hypothetical protein